MPDRDQAEPHSAKDTVTALFHFPGVVSCDILSAALSDAIRGVFVLDILTIMVHK
jgi:hypothetical protein